MNKTIHDLHEYLLITHYKEHICCNSTFKTFPSGPSLDPVWNGVLSVVNKDKSSSLYFTNFHASFDLLLEGIQEEVQVHSSAIGIQAETMATMQVALSELQQGEGELPEDIVEEESDLETRLTHLEERITGNQTIFYFLRKL